MITPKHTIRLFIWITVQLFSLIIYAQDSDEIACEHVNKLKSGTLVVVLESQAKRVALLEKLSTDPKSTPKEMKKYKAILDGQLKDRDTAWYYTILGYTQLYKFSKVAFLMDTSLRCFLDHPASCKYYDNNLKLLTTLPTGPVYVAQYGHVFENQATNLTDAWYVMDDRLKRLPDPFPEQIKYNFFQPSFLQKLPKQFRMDNHISAVKGKHRPLLYAIKLDKRLNKFYKKSRACS